MRPGPLTAVASCLLLAGASAEGEWQPPRVALSRTEFAQARAGEPQSALEGADAMWRIGESIASRPELIAHLIMVAKLKWIVGLLRKIDDPAFGWESRLRERGFFR